MTKEKMFQTQGMMAARAPRKGKGKIILAALLILVIGFWGVAAWGKMLTDPIPEVPRQATLEIESGAVMITDVGAANPREAKNGDVLTEGMKISTGKNTTASLKFFDESIARLAPETDLTLEQLQHDPARPAEDKVGIFVRAGRVWSRVLNLLHPEASYTVKSSTTVATVRGTANDFFVDNEGWTHVKGDHSITSVTATTGWQGLVDQKTWVHIPKQDAKKDSAMMKQAIKLKEEKGAFLGEMELVKDENWFKKNRQGDRAFVQRVRKAYREEHQRLAKPLKNPVARAVANATLDVRAKFEGEEKREQMIKGMMRREVALANVMMEEGKAGEAARLMRGTRERVRAVQHGDGLVQEMELGMVRNGAMVQMKNWELIKELPGLGVSEEQKLLLRSALIEHRIELMKERGEKVDVPSDVWQAPREVRLPLLRDRLEYLKLEAMEAPLEVKTEATPETVVEIKEGPALTPIEPKPEPLPVLEPKPVTTEPIPIPIEPKPEPTLTSAGAPEPVPAPKLSISGAASIQAEESAQFTATLAYPDGKTVSVTSRCAWTVEGNAKGTISANGFYQSQLYAGTDTVQCTLTEGDLKLAAAQKIVVEPHLDIVP